MAKPDWLSIEEISRLWGEETGSDPAAFQQDLEAWFAAFVKQSPGAQAPSPGKGADTTNRLMGMLGASYLERQTFEAYCEERGHAKPQFWFGGRIEDPQRDATRQPLATPPRSVEEPPSPSPAGDPELDSFQTQIADMGDRLKPPSFEFRRPGPSSADDSSDRGSPPGPSAPPAESSHRELIERADAASAEARQLEAQLGAAEQRIAELNAAGQASHLSPPAHSSAPDAPSPTALWQGATAGSPHAQQESASYQDPSTTGQRLRHDARRKGRGKAALVAGLAVTLAAVAAVVIWGTQNGLQITDNAPASSPSETTEWSTGAGSADAQDLAAAQRQIAGLTAAVEASSSEAARLRGELAIARQTLESIRQVRSAGTGSDAEEQQRKLALAAVEEASNLRAALAGAEQKIAALDTQLESARDATSTARAETARLRTAMLQAKGQTDAELRVLSLATTASSARITALQRDLASARQEITELDRDKDAAAADAAGLRKQLSAAELRIDELADAAGAATEAPSLQADLAAAERKIAGHDDALEAARVSAAAAERKIAALREELEASRDAAADADTRAADAQADAARLRTALRQAKDQTGSELQDQSLAVTVSSARVAELQRDLDAARQRIADLSRDRSAVGANASGLRASLESAQQQTEALREELALKATASSAQLATLRRDLRSAERRIADLNEAAAAAEDEAAKLRQALAAERQADAATGSPSAEPVVETGTSALREAAAARVPAPEIEASPPTETSSSNSASGGFEQVAALAPNEAVRLTDAIADTVSPDDLLLAPGRHLGQEVVVSGSVVWLLWRYRLQSNNGSDSMVVDVDGLQPATQQELEKAIDRVGILGEVQARIRGTVVRKDAESYRLAASELVLTE